MATSRPIPTDLPRASVPGLRLHIADLWLVGTLAALLISARRLGRAPAQ